MTRLHFMVIGAQKAGTTSLWQYLQRHPGIAMPALKEMPFFSTERAMRPGGFEDFMADHFGDAPGGTLLGKATTAYMRGGEEADVGEVARRVAAQLPRVRLIALLRDPIERAISQYRMSARRGLESRSFDAAVEELLDAEHLSAARRRPTETNSYLVQGEYGRVLGAYREHFPAGRLHVEQSHDLAEEPQQVVDRVLGFLGLGGEHRPANLGVRYNRGGSETIDADRERWLFDFLAENVWPSLEGNPDRVKRMFSRFYEVWSVEPDDVRPTLSPSLRSSLEAHYRADAELLARLDVATPWIEAWDAR